MPWLICCTWIPSFPGQLLEIVDKKQPVNHRLRWWIRLGLVSITPVGVGLQLIRANDVWMTWKSPRTCSSVARCLLYQCVSNTLLCYLTILFLNALIKPLYQTAGFTTRGNGAICIPDGSKADTTWTAQIKGQYQHPIMFYGCRDNTDQYECSRHASISDSSFLQKERYWPYS